MSARSITAAVLYLLRTRFVQDVLALQVGSVFARILGLVQSVLYARLLGLQGFGVYALVLAFQGTFTIIANYGQNQATSTFFSEAYSKKDREGMKQVFRYYIYFSSVSAGVLATLALFAPTLSTFFYDDPSIGVLAQIAFLAAVAGSFHTLFLIVLQTVRKITVMTVMENANLALQVALALLFLHLGFGIAGIFSALLVANVFMQGALLLQYRFLCREYDLPGIRESLRVRAPLKEFVQQGLWIALHKNLANYVLPSTLFLMSFFVQESEIGIARLAYNIGLLPASLLLSHAVRMSATVLPAIRQKGIHVLRANVARLIKHTILFHSLFSFGGMLILPWLVLFFYGQEFSGVITPMLWIILIALSHGITVANTALFRISRESHIPALWHLAFLPLTLLVLALGLQRFDAMNAFVIAILVYHIGNTGPCWHICRTTLRKDFSTTS